MISSLKNILLMLIFVLLQVVIFNNIHFLGYINPYVYILFILILPLNTNRYGVLVYAFILGFLIDLFENTGGVNTFSIVLVAFLRTPLVRLLSRNDLEEIRFSSFSAFQWSIYLIFLIFIHSLTVDFIESLQWDNFSTIIERSLIGTVITFIFSIIYISFFPPKSQSEL